MDPLLPLAMARKAESVGSAKVRLAPAKVFVLAMLAGAFIALGGAFSMTTQSGLEGVPFGLVRLVAGLTFSLGLILVAVAGAELFTGNNLVVMAWASGKVTTRELLSNWAVVYLGNFVGAMSIALLAFLAEHHLHGGSKVGALALSTASAKLGLSFQVAVFRGVLCNVLVCLAVWLCMSARSSTDKVLVIVLPIAAFVALGFEHSIANMYFVPFALLIRGFSADAFWATIGRSAADYPHLTFTTFLTDNLLPVTIGNVIGGAVMVGLVYWYVYLRGESAEAPAPEPQKVSNPARYEALYPKGVPEAETHER